MELPGKKLLGAVVDELGNSLDFTSDGITFLQLQTFFEESLSAAKRLEPIIEAGNKYSVSQDFAKMNGALLLHDIQHSAIYRGLSAADQHRADEFFSYVCLHPDLRNRNPLHPSPLDSAVIGNLLNFPKHLFGFPYAGYSTNGAEALSLCLFGYRAENMMKKKLVIVGEERNNQDIAACATRLSLGVVFVKGMSELSLQDPSEIAVVVSSLGKIGPMEGQALDSVSEWCMHYSIGFHVHVLDIEFRTILESSTSPIHLQLPPGIRSMSIEEGLFQSGYQLHRDPFLRDLYIDLPYEWQSQYASPNEGGSGNSTPLFVDFCFIMLGWKALRDAAKASPLEPPQRIQARALAPYHLETGASISLDECQAGVFEDIKEWATGSVNSSSRVELETNLFQFQRNFVGGKERDVEAIITGGGTRSINLAIESVLAQVREKGLKTPKLITGNPHLAVERAERRFLYEVIRVTHDGIIDLQGLKEHIANDTDIVMVYVQTLAITDGITDPLKEVVHIVEEENLRRSVLQDAASYCPVTIINDCCLALSVLLHNDGENGACLNHRVLDLTEGCITPTIVTLDAHKHIGADKGISMVMGTKGTLSSLNGHIKVGAQPTNGGLIRAMADMLLVGVQGYHTKYQKLAISIDKALESFQAAGMTVIHSHNRAKGSTAFGIEDPSAVVQKMLKKKGHGPAPLFRLCPADLGRCQTGWLMSATPHWLREVNGVPAIDVFVADVIECHKAAAANRSSLAKLFRPESLPAIILSGGLDDTWTFAQLHNPGFMREALSLVFRRLYSGIMDSGVVCAGKRVSALSIVLTRSFFMALFVLLARRWLQRR